MRFLVDENLAKQIVAGLSGFGEHAEHVLAKFDPGAADEAWLEYAGTHHLTVVTRDLKIIKRPSEMAAFRHHSVGAFLLAGQKISGCEIIQQVVRNWSKMKTLAANTERPFAFRVARSRRRITRMPLNRTLQR